MLVVGYVISGRWKYLEHDWTAEEGSFVFEPPGEVHTLTVPADCPEMITFFNIQGAMIYVDADGRQTGYEDVWTKIDMCRAHYRDNGLGAAYVDAVHPLTPESAAGMRGTAVRGADADAGVDCRGGRRRRRRRVAALGLSFALNPVFPTIPLGTLAANLVGGLLMGVAMELITRHAIVAGNAAARHDGFSRRAHDVLDVLRRSHDTARAPRMDLERADHRICMSSAPWR